METGRAGNVDFGQVAADNVQTCQQDTAAFEFGGEGFGDFSVAFTQFLRHAASACRQIAACFAVLRNTRQSIGDDFAADNQDAFVAVDDFGDVALCHDGAGIKLHQGFEDTADVWVFFGQAKNAHAAHAVQRFDDDVAVFFQKCADIGGTGRNQRRRGELAEIQNRQFFIEVAHRLPAVKDLRALLFRQRQELGGVEVLHIERRVGAHNDGIEVFQGRLNFVCRFKPFMVIVAFGTEKLKRRSLSCHQSLLYGQFAAQGMEKLPAAFCHFAHHGVGGVFVGFETCHRIGNKQDFHGNFLINKRRNHTFY